MPLEPITLNDPSGSVARILPAFGFNCYSFEVVHGEARHEVLWSHPEFTSGSQRPSHSGIPILFPFPGRIRGRDYAFEGQQYSVEGQDDGRGNAIHGFVLDRAWEVVDRSETTVVGRFVASVVEPKILDWWPSDFTLTVSYTLSGNQLSSELTVTNSGDGRLPFGLGTHAYFRVPLSTQSERDVCRITVPASKIFALDGMLPTGNTQPVSGSSDLREGLAFADAKFDDMFTGLTFADGLCTTSIEDPAAGRRLTLAFDEFFGNCVVYNPPHREAVCIEPYSAVPDAFTLLERGIDPGLRILAPGETVSGRTELRVD